MADTPAETTYYNAGGVTITNKRAVLGSTTYAMGNVTSVGVGRHVPSVTPALLTLVVTAATLLFYGGALDGLAKVFTVVFGVLTVLVFISTRNVTYYVRIVGAGGEQRALSGYTKGEVERIVAALNEAIIQRG